MSKQPLIILSGPTSVGKTELSISLAKAINGEIISADSMQVYKHMDIGTAKIKPHEMGGIPHYLIDELEPDDEFNVVRFQEFAKQYMSMVYEKNKIPIIVGGTGFYIQAVLYDIDFTSTPTDCSYRTELELLLQEHGSEYLHDILKEVDPESAKAIHPNNSKRVIRALEFIKQTGTRISEHNEEQRDRQSPYQYCYFVLNKDRAKLYESINQRVDIMLKEGLVEEVAALRQQGYHRDLVSMQGLGYKEIYAYLEGECTLEEAIYILKRDTRHFAKRQLTWFRRERNVTWIDKKEFGYDDEKILHRMELLCIKN